jgi:hypothetical protein
MRTNWGSLGKLALNPSLRYWNCVMVCAEAQTKHTVNRLILVVVTSPTSPANSQAAQHPISPTISIQPFVKPAWSRTDYYRLTVSTNPRVPLLQ